MVELFATSLDFLVQTTRRCVLASTSKQELCAEIAYQQVLAVGFACLNPSLKTH